MLGSRGETLSDRDITTQLSFAVGTVAYAGGALLLATLWLPWLKYRGTTWNAWELLQRADVAVVVVAAAAMAAGHAYLARRHRGLAVAIGTAGWFAAGGLATLGLEVSLDGSLRRDGLSRQSRGE